MRAIKMGERRKPLTAAPSPGRSSAFSPKCMAMATPKMKSGRTTPNSPIITTWLMISKLSP